MIILIMELQLSVLNNWQNSSQYPDSELIH